MNLPSLFQLFLQERQYLKNCSPKTTRAYRQAWGAFEPYLREAIDPSALRAGLKAGVVTLLAEGRIKPTSVNAYQRAWNAFLGWATTEGHLLGPVQRVGLLKAQKSVLKVLTPEQVLAVFTHRPRNRKEARICAVALLILDTGMRIDEVLHLRPSDVDWDNLLVKVSKGKGRKERVIPFSLALRKRLYRYWTQYGQSQNSYLFSTSSGTAVSQRNALRDLKVMGSAISLPHLRFHLLRHTFATHYLKSGGSIALLRKVLGHSSITTTQIYEHLQTEDLSQVHHRHSILMSR